MLNLIKKSGYKITKPRKMILNVLLKNKNHLSAKQILKKTNNVVDLTSIYRTLYLFKKIGIIFEEKIDKESFYYLSDKKHHHIICRNCQKTKCIPCEHKFKKIKNFTNIKHNLVLNGLCEKCNK
jgi:Fur family ferric uptake transcriptional regulator